MMHSWTQFFRRIPRVMWLAAVLIVLYFSSRFFALNALPVFADEAIYIRWAQLIFEDSKYLFFSVNDGKPPLFIWALLPALNLLPDPVFAGRAVSILIGALQLGVLWLILRNLKASKVAHYASSAILLLAPFWFFHQRMALMDGLLTLGISVAWLGLMQLDQLKLTIQPQSLFSKSTLSAIALTGLGWGVALWTKTPALFFAPVFALWALGSEDLWHKRFAPTILLPRLLVFGAAGALGLAIFALLRLAPAFGSLFGRSTDFTYTFAELLQGEWRWSINNFPKVLSWLSTYMRPELLSLSLFSLLFSEKKWLQAKILLSAFIWAFPLLLLGKVLHARYFLPMAPFITVSAALFFAEVWEILKKYRDNLYIIGTFFLIILFFLIGCLRFIFFSYFSPSMTPFVLDDRVQYLTEWSSGHGIPEVRDLLLERSRQGLRTTVVTEGSFGTLPDGLLLYFDRRPEIANLRIEGLAQYPVKFIPEWVRIEAATTETWLIVNSHRLDLNPETDGLELIARYPRPYGAPDLQVYRIQPE